MRWSLKVAHVAGTDVYVHATFFALLAWIGVVDGLEKGSIAAAAAAVAFTTMLFVCVVLHEFGHASMSRRFGIQTRDIVLYPFGGVGHLERIPDVPSQEFLIALAGPAVSLSIALVLFAVVRILGGTPHLEDVSGGNTSVAERLILINIALAAFNLLPAFPMDGGRVLRALLAMRLDYARATELAARVGQAMAVLFAIVGAWLNPLLILIALFVWVGATGEAALAQVRQRLQGARADAAMRTDFATLSPGDAIGRAAELTIRHAQSDFPVVEDGQVVGMLTHRDVARWLSEDAEPRLVDEVMHRTFEIIDRSEPLEAVFGRLQQEPEKTLIVTDHGRLAGLVGLAEIATLLRITRSISRRLPVVPIPRRPAHGGV